MNKRKLTVWMGTAALVTAGFLGVTATVRAADRADSEVASKLLSEAKTMSFQLKEDAVSMESFTRMDVSWETHAEAINQIKDHVNALGKQHVKLLEVEPTASAWQRTAIDRILPFLDELEGYTNAVIEHFNEQPKHFLTAEYKDYLEANADYASDLAKMIANFVDYGKTKQRLMNLTDDLELPVPQGR